MFTVDFTLLLRSSQRYCICNQLVKMRAGKLNYPEGFYFSRFYPYLMSSFHVIKTEWTRKREVREKMIKTSLSSQL